MKNIFGTIAGMMVLYGIPQLVMNAQNRLAFWMALIGLSFIILFPPPANGFSLGVTPTSQLPVSQSSNNLEFLSTITVFDQFHMPSKYAQLIRRFGDQGLSDFDQILILGGGSESESQTTWSVRLEDLIVSKLKISSFTSPSASYGGDANTADVVVHADVISNGKFYVDVGDTLILPNNETNAVVIAKNGTTLTLALPVAGGSWGALVNGSELGVAFTTFAEESDQPAPKTSTISEEQYRSHILKATTRASGSELIRMPWVTKMSDGTAIPTSFSKGVFDAEYRLKQAIAGATFFAQPITNTASYFANTTHMTGIVPWVRIGGVVDTLGIWNINKLYAMSRQFRKYYAPREYIMKCAGDAHIEIEKSLTNLFTNEPSIFAFGGALEEKEIKFGFKTVTLDDRKWHISRLDLVNHPEIYDLPNYALQRRVIVMPNSQTRDKKSGGDIPYLKYVFCSKDGTSRRVVMWPTGGPIAKNETIDRHQLNLLAECGTKPVCSNHWGMFE